MNEVIEQGKHQGYAIQQTQGGKYVRKAVYEQFSSVIPTTKDEKIKYFNLLNDDSAAFALSENVGAKIYIADVIFNPYDKVDEETGEMTYGVLSYIIDQDGNAFVTSSKSVYFTLKNMFRAFGEPHYTPEEAVQVEIVKKKGQQFQYIDLKVIG